MVGTSFLSKTLRKAKNSKQLSRLLILLSFLITFVVVRVITHLQKANLLPNQQGALHIHHMVPGIILLLISGYVGISFWSHEKIRLVMSVLFGIGAALTIDEFALWLFLKDVYWAKQGRDSVDAVIVVASLLTIVYLLSAVHNHYFLKRLNK